MKIKNNLKSPIDKQYSKKPEFDFWMSTSPESYGLYLRVNHKTRRSKKK